MFDIAKPLAPAELVHIYDVERSFRQGDGLFQVMTDVVVRGKGRALNIQNPVVPTLQRAGALKELVLGVKEERFWALFVQCALCKTVTFRTLAAPSTPHRRRRHNPYDMRERRLSQRTAPATPQFLELVADSPESPGPSTYLRSPPSVLPSSDDPPTPLEFLNSILGRRAPSESSDST
ncbi:hypothetical protein DFP72DRAFT_853988 [Ephemerocybe angulata]|uniref:Uncharacterized protein n=1 Tax=Ephemerocybe angulata TaxID=980116 RepID=A0A8H6M119_9AGAR|nr:hypothetical protein DFP72DRAFT_853988 [Tulosesus angulatus]